MGANVGGCYSHGTWPQWVRKAIADGAVSISPLELLKVSICLHLREVGGEMLRAQRCILRNDNGS